MTWLSWGGTQTDVYRELLLAVSAVGDQHDLVLFMYIMNLITHDIMAIGCSSNEYAAEV